MFWYRALFAALTLAWPFATQGLSTRLLPHAERLGVLLGELDGPRAPAPESALQQPVLPAPSTLPLGEREVALELSREALEQGLPGTPNGTSKKGKTAQRAALKGTAAELPLPKKGLRVSNATVLRLARQGAVPSSSFVPKEQSRPAGLRLSGAAALGIGMQEGDVLTHVAGTPVSDRGQVVNLVLQARANHVPRISGRFYRDGEPWMLVVELPYPEPSERPASARSKKSKAHDAH